MVIPGVFFSARKNFAIQNLEQREANIQMLGGKRRKEVLLNVSNAFMNALLKIVKTDM